MSAFMVHPEHLKELAAYAGGIGTFGVRVTASWLEDIMGRHGISLPRPWTTLDAVAEILRAENARSVAYRYGEEPSTETVRAEMRPPRLGPVAILKMLACLEYQSCECPDYRESAAHQLIERLRVLAISELDGYEDAPWEYCGAEPRARDAA